MSLVAYSCPCSIQVQRRRGESTEQEGSSTSEQAGSGGKSRGKSGGKSDGKSDGQSEEMGPFGLYSEEQLIELLNYCLGEAAMSLRLGTTQALDFSVPMYYAVTTCVCVCVCVCVCARKRERVRE